MLTVEQALEYTDPNAPDEQRKDEAARMVASAEANRAYYDSRSQLDQILAVASGATQIPSHAELNPVNPEKVGGSTGGTSIEKPVKSQTEIELDAARERVAALEAANAA